MPNGSRPLTALTSVITPALSILAMLPFVDWVNQTVPSGDAAMPPGPGLLGVGTWPPRRRRVEPSDALCNEPRGEPDLTIGGDGDLSRDEPIRDRERLDGAGCRVEAGDAAVEAAVNQTSPALSTTTSLGSRTGNWVDCLRRRRSATGCRC